MRVIESEDIARLSEVKSLIDSYSGKVDYAALRKASSLLEMVLAKVSGARFEQGLIKS